MVQKLRQRMGREEGFTLVELLVVMLILGLLAAIAIPSFFNQRDKAKDADTKAAARTAQTAIETYATDNGGSYVGADATDLIGIESTLSDAGAANISVPTATADEYSIAVTQPDTGNVFTISRASDGTTTQTCTTAGEAGCPTGGNWGD